MKMRDAEFLEEKLTLLMDFPIIKANIQSLIKDFDRVYEGALSTDHPEEVPEIHLRTLKTDLLTAFCHGAKEATFLESEFRKNFSLPKEIMDEISKPKIILPDSKLTI